MLAPRSALQETGHRLGTAVEAALAVAEDFDVVGALYAFLADGIVIGCMLPHETMESR